jgi:hypothetical protein
VLSAQVCGENWAVACCHRRECRRFLTGEGEVYGLNAHGGKGSGLLLGIWIDLAMDANAFFSPCAALLLPVLYMCQLNWARRIRSGYGAFECKNDLQLAC